jgi:Protein of unknown function (DUF1499)
MRDNVDVDAHIEEQPSPTGGARWPRLLAVLACAVALAVVLSGFGVRLGLWDYQTGFEILRVAPYVALAIGAVALIALLSPRGGAQRVRPLAVAFVVGAVASAAPLAWSYIAREGPPINDITTDAANPPEFKAVIPLRGQSPVPAEYPGEATAAQQRSGYPDLHAAIVPLPPAAAFDAALAAARDMGWDIVASDAGTGRIEAMDTTPWFGFTDDIVVRITPESQGSRIDVRSASRVGRGDLGTNARRIRRYVAKLAP